MQPVYPTREEILAYRPIPPPQLTKLFRAWKRDIWLPYGRKSSNPAKYLLISSLVNRIAVEIYNKPVEVMYIPTFPLGTCYQIEQKRIILTDPPSILSALHELGHHLYGESELDACRFSVHLFKEEFPKSFAKLTWKGHQLVKK